jgi:hypothetical protein
MRVVDFSSPHRVAVIKSREREGARGGCWFKSPFKSTFF